MTGIHFPITGDSSNFMQKLREVENGVRNTSKSIEQSGTSIEAMFDRITQAAVAFGGAFTAKEFVRQVVQIRGQFQQLEIAFKTMLGSEEKATDLMSQLVRTAATTPFDLQGVTQGAKQLLAYGTAAEDVNETIVRLGDIAAGLSIPLGDLVYLYGTTMTQGRMFTQDLRQFQGRGIPIAEELAKQFGVTKDKVGELVTAGKVGAEEFQKAIWNMTNEGGKFGGLMEAQSKTITGQISNIEDAIDQMFNDIGKSSEGAINTALDGVSYLVENYEKVGREIMALVAAYGAYKAVLMSVAAYQTAVTDFTYATEITELSKLIPAKEASINADLQSAVASGKLSQERAKEVVAIRLQIAALVEKAEVEQKTAASAALSAQKGLDSASEKLEIAQKEAEIASEMFESAKKSGNAQDIATAKTIKATAASRLKTAQTHKETAATALNDAKTKEKIATEAAETLKTQANTAAKVANAKATNILTIAKTKLVAVSKALGLSMLTNPYVLLVTAIVAAGAAMWAFADKTSNAEKAQKALNDRLDEVKKKYEEYNAAAQKNISIASDEYESTQNRADALNKLAQKYPEIIKKYIDEEGHLTNILQLKKEIAGFEANQEEQETINEAGQARKAVEIFEQMLKHQKGEIRVLPKEVSKYIKAAEKWYEDLTGNNSSFHSVEEKLSFARQMANQSQQKVNRLKTESKANKVLEDLGGYTDEQLQQVIDSDRRRMKLFNDKVGYVYDEFTKDYLKKTDVEARLVKAEGIQAARNKTVIRDEAYWQEQKKAAEAELKALEKTGENIVKAQAIKDRIAAIDEELEFYSTSSRGGATSDPRIKAEQDAADALEKLRNENAANEVKSEADKGEAMRKQIEANYQKRLDEIDKQERKFKELNEKAGLGKDYLTDEQQTEISTAKEIASNVRDKEVSDIYKEEAQAMRDYLKEYGSFQQQKLAIAEEYAQKIKDATTEWEKLSLQKESEEKLSKLSFENISMGIDWKSLFSGIDSLSKDMLKPMMEQLIAFTKTDDYNNADSQTQSDVAELIQELRSYLGSDTSATWETLAIAMDNFNRSVAEYKNAVEAEKAARERVEQAKKDLAEGNITQEEYDEIVEEAYKLGEATVSAKEAMNGFATDLNNTSEKVKNFTSKLSTELKNAGTWKGLDGFGAVEQAAGNIGALSGALNSVLPKLADGMGKNIATSISGSLASFGSGLTGMLSKGMGVVVGAVAQIPQLILGIADAIKNFATGIINGFAELFELRWIDELVNSILGAISNLVTAIFDLPENLYKVLESIVVNGIGGLLDNVLGRVGNVLTLGLLSSDGPSDWFTNSNAAEVAKEINQLQDSIDSASAALEIWKDRLEDSFGSKAVKASEAAIELQESVNRYELQQAKAQAGYHNSHHSWNYYWDGFSEEQIAKLNEQIAEERQKSGKGEWTGSLWDLSPEEMKQLAANPDMVDAIKNTGKGGYGNRVWAHLEDYIEQADKLQEITDQLNETLTGISFDSFRDGFISDIMDMSKATEDFVADFEKQMAEAAASTAINEALGDDMERLYKGWAEAAKDGGISPAETARLTAEQERIAKQAQAMRDGVFASMGYDPNEDTKTEAQERTVTGAESISNDTAKALEGRATAIQLSEEEQKIRLDIAIATLNNIATIQTNGNNTLNSILRQHIITNSHLEDMVQHTKTMQSFGVKFDTMIEILNKRL